MFCRKCGKFIDYDSEYCNECKQAEERAKMNYGAAPIAQGDCVQPVQQTDNGSVTTGLAKAIAAAILCDLGVVLSVVACIVTALLIAGDGDKLIGYFLIMISTGMIVVGTIFAIQSVVVFVREKKAGRKKPIPALILGISGLSCAPFALYFCFINAILVLGLLMNVVVI